MQMMESLFQNLFLILGKGPAFLPTSSVPAPQHRAALLGTTLFSQICWEKRTEKLKTQMAITLKGVTSEAVELWWPQEDGPLPFLCVYAGQPRCLLCNDVCIRRSPKV